MPKWEYLTIYVATIETDTDKENILRVTRENDKPLYKKGLMGKDYKDCPNYVDYLLERGEEGWEMVNISSTGGHILHVAFKRPKP